MRRNFDKLRARVEALEQQNQSKKSIGVWDDGTEESRERIKQLEAKYDTVVVVGWDR